MNFVAIDFETANAARSSACSLGIICYENDKAVFEKEYLINPYPNYYDDFNTKLHGISAEATKNAPAFDKVWAEVYPLIAGRTVLAHNAAFDMSVVRYALDAYNTPYGSFDYFCTYLFARAALPNMGSYKLNMLCNKYNIPLTHHRAVDDARAAAELFLRIAHENEIYDFETLAQKYALRAGKMHAESYTACGLKQGSYANTKEMSVSDINNLQVIYEDSDFVGKNFVFTGALLSMTRQSAMQLVAQAGGKAQNIITKDTNYLVTGIQDIRALKDGYTQSSKQIKAMALAQSGQPIQVITEDEFISLIDEKLWAEFVQAQRTPA